jgi:hypothetical protein
MEQASAPLPSGEVTIWIVSRNPRLQTILLPVIEKEGYSVSTWSDRELALDAARVKPPSLMVVTADIDDAGTHPFVLELYGESSLQRLPIVFMIPFTAGYPGWVWQLWKDFSTGRRLAFGIVTLPIGRGELEYAITKTLNFSW